MQEPLPQSLASLVSYLDRLTNRAPTDALSGLLIDSKVTLNEVQRYLRFDEFHCRRIIVAESTWYELVVLCWRSGQRGPIHDHANSSGVFRVLTGVCRETTFGFAPSGDVFPLQTEERGAGEVIVKHDADTHQLANLQPAGQDLVTLNIYSPPLKAMKTFSLDTVTFMADGVREAARNPASGLNGATALCLTQPQLEKVVRFMHAHIGHDVHVIDFANQTGHAVSHFAVLFKNKTGCSPFQYIKEIRMQEAHRKLVAGERNLKGVAEAVGYTNEPHFSEVFRAYWKYSPRELLVRLGRRPKDHRT